MGHLARVQTLPAYSYIFNGLSFVFRKVTLMVDTTAVKLCQLWSVPYTPSLRSRRRKGREGGS